MPQDHSRQFDLGDYPRQPIAFKLTRRQLFLQVAQEWAAQEDAARGRPIYRLAELGSLPDEGLAALVPRIAPDCHITVAGEDVCAQLPGDARPRLLFRLAPEMTYVFNAINGLTTIDDISTRLAAAMGWDKLRAFALVRGLFLHLVELRVCVPT